MRAGKYRRNGWWTIKVPHPSNGIVCLAARSKDDKLAARMVAMCDTLMERPNDHWALVGVCDGTLKLRTLYNHYTTNTLADLRAAVSDIDLAPVLSDWRGHLVTRFGEPDAASHTVNQYTRQVAHFFAFAGSTHRSALSAHNASRWVASLTSVTTGRRARYWAALKAFVGYLQSLGLVQESPIAKLPAPPLGDPRERHLSHEDVIRLVEASDGPMRVAETLAHIGMELGAVRAARAGDVDADARTIYAHGTKRKKGRKNYRSRRCHVPAWARGYVLEALRGLQPNDRLVPLSELVIQKRHAETCAALGISDYRFHDGRHTYAVAMVKAGAPSRVVGKQLGHKDGQQVERVYANYAPTMQELEYWTARMEAMRPQRQTEVHAVFSPSISGQDVCPSQPEYEANNGRIRDAKGTVERRVTRWASTKPLTFSLGPSPTVVTR